MTWVRLFNPFGPGEDERRLIPKLCRNLINNQIMEFDAAIPQEILFTSMI